ncbi:tetratricopeptide repeat protein [Sorangium sp. So ce1000]|uniref:tetratricopeptide repeat protein n=1 Tax=Sorangium sp. So ce1000 TaxID=3133325 RepID=UPI003F60386D
MTADCRSELLTRVRRGVATEPDRLAFDAHLVSCASCRISWVLAKDFDAAGAAEPGDAALLARIANAAIGGAVIDLRREGALVRSEGAAVRGEGAAMGSEGAAVRGEGAAMGSEGAAVRGKGAAEWGEGAAEWGEGAAVWLAGAPARPDNDVRRNDVRRGDDDARPGTVLRVRRPAGWTRSAWLYAAAAVLVAGTAAAAAALVQLHPAAEVRSSARSLDPSLRAAVARRRAAALPGAAPSDGGAAPALAAPASAPAPADAASLELASPAPKPRDAARGPSAAPSPTAPATAEQLFREANDARRAGSSRRAIELYRALQKGFATSPEATLSLVSLGGLLLNAGSADAALAQFDRYLGVAGSRPLAVEALYGRGRALRALGRTGDEAQTWRRLLREHPGSPYVEQARRRLAELGG